jgi:hypothetical protein
VTDVASRNIMTIALLIDRWRTAWRPAVALLGKDAPNHEYLAYMKAREVSLERLLGIVMSLISRHRAGDPSETVAKYADATEKEAEAFQRLLIARRGPGQQPS